MKKKKKKFLLPRSAKGQSLVELAVSLVILLYLLSGAAEFGILFFQYIQLRDAAQEGALYGSVYPQDPAKIIERVRASSGTSPINLQDPAVTVEVWVDPDATVDGDEIQSTDAAYANYDCEGKGIKLIVSYDHEVFMPFMAPIIGKEIPLNAIVTDTILSPHVC